MTFTRRLLKGTGIIFSALCYLIIFTGCWWFGKKSKPEPSGIPDPLANDNINQYVVKGENWRQIAADRTLFKLGEADRTPYESQTYGGGLTYNYYRGSYGKFPAIDGSTVLIPMAAEFVWQFTDISGENNGYDSDTLTFLNFSTTSGAYEKLIYGLNTDGRIFAGRNTYFYSKRPDIVLATYPSEAELRMAEQKGVRLIIKPVCYDSFVFITHKDNPIDNLTSEQVRRIYSGEITNWQDAGGDDAEIIAYQREPKSGSQTYMEESVMQGVKMADAPMARVPRAMGMLMDAVAGYENGTMSLGYTYKYYADRLYTNPDIKILNIDGVTPSDQNVREQTYPFIAAYNAVIRAADQNATGGKFLEWILSDEGQACIEQAGYVSLRDTRSTGGADPLLGVGMNRLPAAAVEWTISGCGVAKSGVQTRRNYHTGFCSRK